jgi:hypothetical protein
MTATYTFDGQARPRAARPPPRRVRHGAAAGAASPGTMEMLWVAWQAENAIKDQTAAIIRAQSWWLRIRHEHLL